MKVSGIWVKVFIVIQSLSEMSRVVGESGKDDITGLGSPYFQNGEAGSRVNVTTQLGSTTYLHCRVNRLGGKMVSWLKRVGGPEDDPHLLTYGRQTYSSDARYQIFQEKPNNWKLQIQYTKISDEGLYECQVSSRTPLIKYTYLTVVVPTIKIVDERLQEVEDQKFYDGGSTIKLKCIVENIVGEQPGYIIWKKGNRMLNYDTERGGISVRTDLLASGAVSRLHIAGANHRDSGNYTCQMGRTAQASIELQIIPGKNAQPIQDSTNSGHVFKSSSGLAVTFVLLVFSLR